MTQEEFIRFKELLTKLSNITSIDGKPFFSYEAGGVSQHAVYDFKITNFILEDELDKPLGFSKSTNRDLIAAVMEAKDYNHLSDKFKISFASVDYGIQKLVNKIAYKTKMADVKNYLDLESLYTVDKIEEASIENEDKGIVDIKETMDRLGVFKTKLEAAKTFTNSDEYKNIISHLDDAIKNLGKIDANSKDAMQQYADVMDSISSKTQLYMDHKIKDGIKDNAAPKLSAVLELSSFASHKSTLVLEQKVNENSENVNDYDQGIKAYHKNLEMVTERLKKLYPEKAEEISILFSSDNSVSPKYEPEEKEEKSVGQFSAYSCVNVLEACRDNKHALAVTLATSMLMSEVICAGGKRSLLLDNIFDYKKEPDEEKDQTIADRFNYLCRVMKKDASSALNKFMPDENITDEQLLDLTKNPNSTMALANEESKLTNSLKLVIQNMNVQSDIVEQHKAEAKKLMAMEEERERVNLENIKKEEERNARIEKYNLNLRNAAAYRFMAAHSAGDKKQQYIEKANSFSAKAMFGEEDEKKTTSAPSKSNPEKAKDKNF